MKTNRLDTITDMLKERVGRVLGEARLQYGGVNPYRYEPIPEKERIYQYLKMSPEVRQAMEQQMPDVMSNYQMQMEKIIQKYRGDANDNA